MLNFLTFTSKLILKLRRDFRQMFRKENFIFARGYKKQNILVIKHRDKKKYFVVLNFFSSSQPFPGAGAWAGAT